MISKENTVLVLAILLSGFIVVVFALPPSRYIPIRPQMDTDFINYFELKDILQLNKDRNLLFVDLRKRKQFDYSHITSSINFSEPWDMIEIKDKLLSYPPETKIVLLNLNKEQNQSIVFYRLLKGQNINNIAIYSGGWEEWKACGLPIDGANEE